MRKKKTIGQEILEAVNDALAYPEKCRTVRPKIDVTAIRKELGLSQSEFSKQYHINIQTLRQWEQGKRSPDTTSLAYLMCIEKRPKVIKEILNMN